MFFVEGPPINVKVPMNDINQPTPKQVAKPIIRCNFKDRNFNQMVIEVVLLRSNYLLESQFRTILCTCRLFLKYRQDTTGGISNRRKHFFLSRPRITNSESEWVDTFLTNV